jgi:hypothetical protein
MKTWQRWALLLGLLLVGAALAPAPDSELGPGLSRREAWALAELPRKPDQAGMSLGLAASPMFEPEVRSAVQSAPMVAVDDRWRIAGVLGRAGQRKVLISFSDPARQAQVLSVGEALPSGHRIRDIESGTVCVQVGRKVLRIGVQAID